MRREKECLGNGAWGKRDKDVPLKLVQLPLWKSLQRPSNTPHSTRRYKNMDILTLGRRVRWAGEGISGMVGGMGIREHPQHSCHVIKCWDPSPGICVSVSSGCPGRSWPRGLRWPRGSAPIPPARAPDGPTRSSGAPLAAGAHDSPRSASVWPDAYRHPTPLQKHKGVSLAGLLQLTV